MSIETRPDLHSLPEDQRILGLAHWYVWLCMQRLGYMMEGVDHETFTLHRLEAAMQPKTLHLLALARGRYFRE
jgi:hypothetical protein